jgi:hypothetical protein
VKAGDLVRFKYLVGVRFEDREPWKIGLLIKYDKPQKIGSILHCGKIIRLRGAQIQLASRYPNETENI